MTLYERIDATIRTRALAADLVRQILPARDGSSEVDVRDALQQAMAAEPSIHDNGWYAPPPGGIFVLLADHDHIERSRFVSPRLEPYWPQPAYLLGPETTGTVYLSPVDKASGMIGDFGMCFYLGERTDIQNHLKLALETTEEIADHATVGMTLKDVHDFGQNLLRERRFNNSWTTTFHDQTGTDFGHTIPWSDEDQTPEELAAIAEQPMEKLKDIISHKRRYVNHQETLVIPETLAFTIELQCTAEGQSELPNAYFHTIVTFSGGEKKVLTNFNPIFDALGITYMRSRF